MTKRAGAPAGNTNAAKPDAEKYVRLYANIRPDQKERLGLEPNQNETVRRALDQYYGIHPADDDVDYAAALDAMAADESE